MNLFQGFRLGFPIACGYIPVGIAFGVVAIQSGLTPIQAVLMTALIYAGTSQFAALALIATGQSITTIVVTTLVINLRHILMSAALSNHLEKWPKTLRLLFGASLSDESFLVHMQQFEKGSPTPQCALAVHFVAYISFVLGSMVGCLLHTHIPNIQVFGFDFVIPALYVFLFASQLKSIEQMAIAALTAGTVVVFVSMGLKTVAILASALIGAFIASEYETWQEKTSRSLSF